jgi:hypothetical protein
MKAKKAIKAHADDIRCSLHDFVVNAQIVDLKPGHLHGVYYLSL